jgi:glutamine---fructose-6-phosphate transaminase (isomerizing)
MARRIQSGQWKMKNLKDNPYVQDILSQGESLKIALAQFDDSVIKALAESIQRGRFDRILLTGMGGSYFAAYPTWLILANAGLPAIHVDCAELIHHCRGLVTQSTLVWITSQSGRSAEIVSALELIQQTGASLLASVNDLNSPLAQAAQKNVISIHAEAEKTVSTRTYINTLALGQLAALYLTYEDFKQGMQDLKITADGLIEYFSDWENHLQKIKDRIPLPRNLILLGRGYSLAAAYTGALILGEASKFAAIGMQAGEFRHGPFELASPNLTVFIFAGPSETQELNRRLHKDLNDAGAHALWVTTPEEPDHETCIHMPHAQGIGIPLAEIVPVQILTIYLALENNVEPGKFLRTGKITLSE